MPPVSTVTQPRANAYYAWGVCAFLVLAIGLIYGQTLGHILLDYDDNIFVYGNPHVAPGLTGDGFRWAFTEGPGGEWYPLAMLSHMLDCQIFGLNAWGHHLTNVLVHAVTSIALFLVLRRMTGELWPSALVAVIFAIHPQHVESVAWVAERKDVLSGLFFVLTLGANLGYVRHGRTLGRYALVAVLFALGLLSKPMIVTLPPLLLLLDFWPLARLGSAIDSPRSVVPVEQPGLLRLVLEKLPLFAIVAADSLVTLFTHASRGVTVAWQVRLANGAVSCLRYLVQFFYPADLAAFYPIPPGGPPRWQVVGAIAILTIVTAGAVIGRRRCPYFFVGWFWYLGMLFPVLGVVTLGWFSMADRFMYLPSIGLTIALAWGAARLCAGSLAKQRLFGAGAALAIALLIACATHQASFWRDDETLWTHALACTTDNGEAEVGLADALRRRGQLDQAIPHYRRAVQYATDYSPLNNLGLLLAQQGKLDEAIALFRRAVDTEPTAFDPHANLALALAARNQIDESRAQFRRALEIDPRGVKAHCGLAYLWRREGRLDDARAELELAIQLDSRNTAARTDLGEVLLQQGNVDPSIRQFEAVLAIDPQHLAAHIDLGRAFVACGRIDDAKAHYHQALMIDPNNPIVRQDLDKLHRSGAQPPKP